MAPAQKPTVAMTMKVEHTADGVKITFEGTNPQGQPFGKRAPLIFPELSRCRRLPMATGPLPVIP